MANIVDRGRCVRLKWIAKYACIVDIEKDRWNLSLELRDATSTWRNITCLTVRRWKSVDAPRPRDFLAGKTEAHRWASLSCWFLIDHFCGFVAGFSVSHTMLCIELKCMSILRIHRLLKTFHFIHGAFLKLKNNFSLTKIVDRIFYKRLIIIKLNKLSFNFVIWIK